MSLLENITTIYQDLQIGVSPVLDSYSLMKSPTPILGIMVTYWLFVLLIGPKFMEKRKPFQLNEVMIGYNVYQILFSIWLLYTGFKIKGIREFTRKFGCTEAQVDPEVLMVVYDCGWWYLVNKIVELADTAFMVLRKKFEHISFLHVYHHSNMVIFTWVFLKYASGEQELIIGGLNSLVHVIMYFYYLLTALGPSFRKYTAWKKAMTTIQIAQFVIIIGYFISILVRQCKVHRFVTYMLCLNTVTFLYLFLQYYNKSYAAEKEKALQEAKTKKKVK